METRTIEVNATAVTAARECAIAAARCNLFDPQRVVDAKVVGFVDFGPDGAIFTYRVHVEGYPLTEGEAREIWGV